MKTFQEAIIIDTFRDAELIPDEVKPEIKLLWKYWDLGNDSYHALSHADLDEEEYDDFPVLKEWIRQNLPKDKLILIHYWW